MRLLKREIWIYAISVVLILGLTLGLTLVLVLGGDDEGAPGARDGVYRITQQGQTRIDEKVGVFQQTPFQDEPGFIGTIVGALEVIDEVIIRVEGNNKTFEFVLFGGLMNFGVTLPYTMVGTEMVVDTETLSEQIEDMLEVFDFAADMEEVLELFFAATAFRHENNNITMSARLTATVMQLVIDSGALPLPDLFLGVTSGSDAMVLLGVMLGFMGNDIPSPIFNRINVQAGTGFLAPPVAITLDLVQWGRV